MMYLRNARIVDETGVAEGGLLIKDGRIAAVFPAGKDARADEVIDCRGRYVLPGGIDVHVHANDPGNTQREDFTSVTAAAAAGGVTCIVDMPIDSLPSTVNGASLAEKLHSAQERCLVDFALWGGYVGGTAEDMQELDRGGAAGFKAFMVDAGDDFTYVGHDALRWGFARAAAMGKPILVHAEDQGLCAMGERECRRHGRNSVGDFLGARPEMTENVAVADALRLAAEEGCRVHICHASNPEAVRRVAAARRSGEKATVETCMHYLMFTSDDMRDRPNELKCMPPLRNAAARQALWDLLLAGEIDMIASDHSPCEPWEKAADVDIWNAWGGINGVQAALPLLYSEGVAKRGMSLPLFVRLTAANPARLAGLYPAKGTLREGSDADLAILDPDAEWRWTRDNWHSKHKNSPFLGMSGKGSVVATMVRGVMVFDGENFLVKPGFGRYYGCFPKS